MDHDHDHSHADAFTWQGETQAVMVAGHDDHFHVQTAFQNDEDYNDGVHEILLSRDQAVAVVKGLLSNLGQNDFEEILKETGLGNCVA